MPKAEAERAREPRTALPQQTNRSPPTAIPHLDDGGEGLLVDESVAIVVESLESRAHAVDHAVENREVLRPQSPVAITVGVLKVAVD
jgi:hypothetical protein